MARAGSGRRRRRQDAYGHRAKREGFPARSVYKLEEIARRTQLLRVGHRVLDLGAAPGSWSMFASKIVGGKGAVVAVDKQDFEETLPPNVEVRNVDVLEADLTSFGAARSFDVVLSDMAPSTTGYRHVDQARSFELFMRALDIANHVLEPGGSFVAKIFQSGDFPEAREAVRLRFQRVRVIRPEAVRSESYEVYIVGLGHRAAQPGHE